LDTPFGYERMAYNVYFEEEIFYKFYNFFFQNFELAFLKDNLIFTEPILYFDTSSYELTPLTNNDFFFGSWHNLREVV
jgi:hypothetical protein